MVNRNLLASTMPDDAEIQQELAAAFEGRSRRRHWLPPEDQDFEANKIVNGRVAQHRRRRRRRSTSATRAKASSSSTSGTTRAPTRSSPPKVGDTDPGAARSRRGRRRRHRPVATARRSGRRSGKTIIAKHKEGDVVSGMVTRKIKGGLLVNIGVNVFLPGQPGGHPPAAGHRRLHRPHHRVQDPQDRRGPPQHRRQPPQAASRTSATS